MHTLLQCDSGRRRDVLRISVVLVLVRFVLKELNNKEFFFQTVSQYFDLLFVSQ